MFTIHGITFSETTVVLIITTLISTIKWLLTYFAMKGELPKEIEQIIQRVGQDDIEKLVHQANQFTQMSDIEKHTYVANELCALIKDKLGISIPQAWVNMIVDAVFNRLYPKPVTVVK